ncbi:cytochrome P450 [Kitasatospora sp. NPDC096204]|uniref:cytochrome P450 n=1 Tax=Kitasatospora sp. NPDC096204 TaxID=3364094 RepID=UPI0037F3925B
MPTLSDSELDTQLRTARAALKSVGALGDIYAQLLLGQEDPYPLYERMRPRGPLQRSMIGSWLVVDRALADEILRDRRFGRRTTKGEWPEGPSDFDNSFLAMDPPDHTRLRRIATPAFGPRVVAAFRPEVERACHELLDRVDTGAPFDLMDAYAKQVPARVIGALFGIPEQEQPRFDELCRGLSLVLDGVVSLAEVKELQAAVDGTRELFTELLELRRRSPGDDLVSRLLADVDAERLTAEELVAMCGMLALAGTETTVNLIGNGTLAMLGERAVWERLCADPELAPRAVEESVRYDTSVLMQSRFTHQEIEIAGRRLPVDAQVIILTGACNRDPAAYAEPDRFDLDRTGEPDHISFSSGIHYCLGAPLAKLEAEVAFRVLSQRLPGLRQAGPVRRRLSPFIRGLHAFPVTAS